MKVNFNHRKRITLTCLFMLFILYSCHQDDGNSHEGHSHDSEYKMVNKPFEYFKNLPALLKTTIPKNHKSFFKSKDSIDVYNFAIDSSVVSEITKGTEKFYTMAIYRDGKKPDIDVFENLVVCDRDSVQEAFIVTYFPNTEYDDRLKNNIHSPFIGGVNVIKLDYNKLPNKTSMLCQDFTFTYCDYGGEVHVAGDNCTQLIGSYTITFCQPVGGNIPRAQDREPMRFVDVSPGGGSGGGGGNPDPGTIIMPGNLLDPSEPGIGAVEPGLGDPNGNPVVVTQPVRPKLTAPERVEKEIKDTGLDECSAGVLNELKELTEKDIAKVIAKLDAFPSQYTTNIKTEAFDNTDGQLARTTQTKDSNGVVIPYNYTIKIDPNYASTANKLSLAGTIIHELIHAYLLSLVDDQANGDSNALDEFHELFGVYVTKTFGPNYGLAQHTEMAEKFTDAIARALQEYQTGIPVPENTAPEQIYSDLAWAPLSKTDAYITKFTETEKNRIQNRYAAEALDRTIDTQEPLGDSCN